MKTPCFSVDNLRRFQYQEYIASDGSMIDQLERIWKEALMAQSRYYPTIVWKDSKKKKRKHEKPVTTADIPFEIWTKYVFITSTSIGRNPYTNLFGETALRGQCWIR
jgi:hypothetical protein